MSEFAPAKRGRKTKEQEARAYLADLGVGEEIFDALTERGTIAVPADAEMLEEFKKALYLQMRTGQLKSTALVQGLKAVALIAATVKTEVADDEVGPDRGIDDILAEAGLPLDRRLEIGEHELVRLRERTVALETTLQQMGAAA